MGKFFLVLFIVGVVLFKVQKESMGGEEGMLAYDLVLQSLKDPTSASWNHVNIIWKRDGKGLVELDISAKNGFGGVLRSEFCICVDAKRSLGKVLSEEGGCGSRMPATQDVYKNECSSLVGL